MFYLYGHSMYVSHIAISWLWYRHTSTNVVDLTLNYVIVRETQLDVRITVGENRLFYYTITCHFNRI